MHLNKSSSISVNIHSYMDYEVLCILRALLILTVTMHPTLLTTLHPVRPKVLLSVCNLRLAAG